MPPRSHKGDGLKRPLSICLPPAFRHHLMLEKGVQGIDAKIAGGQFFNTNQGIFLLLRSADHHTTAPGKNPEGGWGSCGKLEFGGQVSANAFVGEAISLPRSTTSQKQTGSGEFVQIPTFYHSTNRSKPKTWREAGSLPYNGWSQNCPPNNNLSIVTARGSVQYPLTGQENPYIL